jgi:hypothetical protein
VGRDEGVRVIAHELNVLRSVAEEVPGFVKL